MGGLLTVQSFLGKNWTCPFVPVVPLKIAQPKSDNLYLYHMQKSLKFLVITLIIGVATMQHLPQLANAFMLSLAPLPPPPPPQKKKKRKKNIMHFGDNLHINAEILSFNAFMPVSSQKKPTILGDNSHSWYRNNAAFASISPCIYMSVAHHAFVDNSHNNAELVSIDPFMPVSSQKSLKVLVITVIILVSQQCSVCLN